MHVLFRLLLSAFLLSVAIIKKYEGMTLLLFVVLRIAGSSPSSLEQKQNGRSVFFVPPSVLVLLSAPTTRFYSFPFFLLLYWSLSLDFIGSPRKQGREEERTSVCALRSTELNPPPLDVAAVFLAGIYLSPPARLPSCARTEGPYVSHLMFTLKKTYFMAFAF